MQAVLVMFRSDGERRSFSISREMTVIGRRQDCDLMIPLGEISRKHCRIIKEADTLRIEDLGSSNGTYHNGRRVQETMLTAGDTIQVGPVTFVVQIDGYPTDDEIQPFTNAAGTAAGAAAVDDGGGEEGVIDHGEYSAEHAAPAEDLLEEESTPTEDLLEEAPAAVSEEELLEEAPAGEHEATEENLLEEAPVEAQLEEAPADELLEVGPAESEEPALEPAPEAAPEEPIALEGSSEEPAAIPLDVGDDASIPAEQAEEQEPAADDGIALADDGGIPLAAGDDQLSLAADDATPASDQPGTSEDDNLEILTEDPAGEEAIEILEEAPQDDPHSQQQPPKQ